MKRIENITDFIVWSKEVNLSTIQCDLQDIYARTTPAELNELFWNASKNEKHLIIFAVNKAMGGEALLLLLHSYISYVANREIIEHIDAYNKEISNDRAQIAIEEKAIEEKKQYIAGIEKENKTLKNQVDELWDTNSILRSCVNNLEDEVKKLNQELTKQYTFENHIKELLKAA